MADHSLISLVGWGPYPFCAAAEPESVCQIIGTKDWRNGDKTWARSPDIGEIAIGGQFLTI